MDVIGEVTDDTTPDVEPSLRKLFGVRETASTTEPNAALDTP